MCDKKKEICRCVYPTAEEADNGIGHDDDLKRRFTYHATKPGQAEKYINIRATGMNLAKVIRANCPLSNESEMAVCKVDEAVMWANAAIARHGA